MSVVDATDEFKVVRNTQKAHVCLTVRGAQGDEEFEWKPAGDDGSFMEIPNWVIKSSRFRNIQAKGILVIMEGAAPIVSQEAENWAARQEAENQSVLSSMDRSPQEFFVQDKCVVDEGKGKCNALVTVREKDRATVAPVCERHEHLRESCMRVLDENAPVDGNQHFVWKFAKMAARQSG